MKNKIYYIGGLPRSGSTLLANLIAQNPRHHVTSTSGLLQLINNIKKTWQEIEQFKSAGIGEVKPKMENAIKGLIHGFYSEYFEADMIIFEKDRAVLNNIELIEEVLDCEVKILYNFRDIKDICSSFEKLQRKNPLMVNNLYGDEQAKNSIYSRTASILSEGGVLGFCINLLKDAITKQQRNRLHIIGFEELTKNPEKVMRNIEEFLGLEQFEYHYSNMKQLVTEDDYVYGIEGLHTIKKDVKYSASDAINILGKQLCDEIDNSYINLKIK